MEYFIYRLYSSSDELLYIGITNDPTRRMRHHRSHSGWYSGVARQDIRNLNCSKVEAEAIERDAINKENPIHNVIHKRRNGGRMTKAVCFQLTEDDFYKLDSICYTIRKKKSDFFRFAILSSFDSLRKTGELLERPVK